MNRNGQGRGMGRGRRGNGNGQGRGNGRPYDEASFGQGRRGGGFGRGRGGWGWQSGPENGTQYNRPLSDFTDGMAASEKKSWLENFKAHLTRRMGEVDDELSKL